MSSKKRKALLKDTSNGSPAADELDFVLAFQMLVGEVTLLNAQILNVALELGRDLNVSPPQWRTLVAIKGQKRTASQLARLLGIPRQQQQYTVNGLLERKLLEPTHNPDHRRAPLFDLTDEGRILLKKLSVRRGALSERFTEDLNLTVEDLSQLSGGLRSLRLQALKCE
jgi:DNA-binding MarR family transcriptional regulator